MKEVKCINCGASITYSPYKKTVCPYCLTEYSNGSILIDAKINNAEINIKKFRDYAKAEEIFREIVEIDASDYRAWWGIVRAQTSEFSNTTVDLKTLQTIQISADKTLKTAPENIINLLKSQWDNYSKAVKDHNEQKEQEKVRENIEKAKMEAAKKKQLADEKARKEKELAEEKAKKEKEEKQKKEIKIILKIATSAISAITTIICINLLIDNDFYINIYKDPGVIGTAFVILLINTIVVTICGSVGKLPCLCFMPGVLGVIATIILIAGMCSHNDGFFLSLMVVVVFGAVGLASSAIATAISYFIPLALYNE